MNRTWLVIKREYLYNLRRRSFLFSAFVLPVIIFGITGLGIGLIAQQETNLDDFERVGVVDNTAQLNTLPPDEEERFLSFPDEESAQAAFEAGEIDGYFVLPPTYFETGEVTFISDEGLPARLQGEFGDYLRGGLATLAPQSAPVERLQNPVDSDSPLYRLGEEGEISEEAIIGQVALPFVFMMVFIFAILTTSQFLMSSLVEEKENRVMEVLVTSIKPLELLLGKVFGLGALSLTQVAFWLVMGLIFGSLTGRLDILNEMRFGADDLALAVLYLLLSYFLFAGISVGIGASVTAEQESRQLASFMVLVAIVPVYAFALFLENPDSPIVLALALFPLTSPLSMLILTSFGSASPGLIVLSVVILLASIALTIWGGALIFRAGMLLYGQRMGVREVMKALRG